MIIAFVALLAAGVLFTIYNLYSDIQNTQTESTTWLPFLLLAVALLIALGFEFVNGFHDTANAVATVIYTNALPPLPAVVWSGLWNFLGVLFSTGAVAFGIISLLPVELILQVGSGAGFAMVVGTPHCSHYLESRHLVFGFTSFKFAHTDRLYHRRRPCQSVDRLERRDKRC